MTKKWHVHWKLRTKGHDAVLVVAIPGLKCGFPFVAPFNTYSRVSSSKVQGPAESVQRLANQGKGIPVLDDGIVQSPVVDA